MALHIRNAVACEHVTESEPYTAHRIRVKWASPPTGFGLWVEAVNPAEDSFTIQIRILRGRELVHETAEELILPGMDRMEFRYQFASSQIQPKAYRVVVLLNQAAQRNMMLDFGAPDAT